MEQARADGAASYAKEQLEALMKDFENQVLRIFSFYSEADLELSMYLPRLTSGRLDDMKHREKKWKLCCEEIWSILKP